MHKIAHLRRILAAGGRAHPRGRVRVSRVRLRHRLTLWVRRRVHTYSYTRTQASGTLLPRLKLLISQVGGRIRILIRVSVAWGYIVH